ncbi:glycosyl hydrolase family 28-related protein, partial [Phytoactinopolyspora endophytica]|uniref:glycosyl hydrolase family 28-related protein n=1 Tax=Phytoactinopolyspora endophytica TaxID=1642495 RepID=UPI003B832039
MTVHTTAWAQQQPDFNVKDYGAAGDGVTDDGAAIRAAIQAAVDAGPGRTVFFPAGRYALGNDLTPEEVEAEAQLLLAGIEDLTLRGANGATLLFTELMKEGVAVYDCTRVVLRDLAIDWDPLPFT